MVDFSITPLYIFMADTILSSSRSMEANGAAVVGLYREWKICYISCHFASFCYILLHFAPSERLPSVDIKKIINYIYIYIIEYGYYTILPCWYLFLYIRIYGSGECLGALGRRGVVRGTFGDDNRRE